MNNENHNSHFFNGLLLGIVVGAAAVFLFGTKSGKNLVKILSEQGFDGIRDLMDEYNLNLDEEDFEDESPEVVEDLKKENVKAEEKVQEVKNHVQEAADKVQDKVLETVGAKEDKPKKRFFKRIRK